MSTESRLTDALVLLADTLVDEYDVVDLLNSLVDSSMQLLGASAAGILLADQRGSLQIVAASGEDSQLLEAFQLQRHEGPCVDALRDATPVCSPDLHAESRWPTFVDFALRSGFQSLEALPMRLRGTTIGGLNVFHRDTGGLGKEELRLAQAFADLATVGVLHQRSSMLAEQLQSALNSRVVIEQAKGVIAERHHVDFDTAFARLRKYARDHNLRLSEAAQFVARQQVELREPMN
jgi:GAF domain-containing protein